MSQDKCEELYIRGEHDETRQASTMKYSWLRAAS
jgi:hypothetical protein